MKRENASEDRPQKRICRIILLLKVTCLLAFLKMPLRSCSWDCPLNGVPRACVMQLAEHLRATFLPLLVIWADAAVSGCGVSPTSGSASSSSTTKFVVAPIDASFRRLLLWISRNSGQSDRKQSRSYAIRQCHETSVEVRPI